ncbi:putative HAF family extracellular repeat protein [Nitrosospira sp. Nsp5]|uniref:Probable extracellular repeat, HAF family n=1 Tax=Nitrosospira multiformis TaxID=1231 RepID=A0ABY0TG64_9PROT|nr:MULTISPECIES: HAF repeat-containing protein [Nitrosospira]PTR10705.1 putative HAF family extracellular repeat protein [Nitrosospira sp. Nsp5]SDQ77233.1 probable extracellular repeat, HAF family [Nitrosospira multiformis]
MKITPGFNLRGFITAVVFLASLGCSVHTSAIELAFLIDLNSRTATDLGTLGGYESWARGINDAGQVVGNSYTAEGRWHAFITGPNGAGMKDLGVSLGGTFLGGPFTVPRGINDAGQVVGSSYTAGDSEHAFITGPNGMGTRDLGTLGSGPSYAYSINDAGQVVGYSFTAEGTIHAFITGPDGTGMRDLGTLGGENSFAKDINDAGQVGGYSSTAEGNYRLFITGPDGVGMRGLDTLGGYDNFLNGINEAGQVVGWNHLTGGGGPGFITGPNGMGIRNLGTLGGGYSEALDINDIGQVVGSTYTGEHIDFRRAFVTGPDGAGMIDLNSLVDLPGIILTEATGINNAGQIIANGYVGYVTFIPEPESHTLLLAGLVLIGSIVRYKKMSASPFSPQEPAGDKQFITSSHKDMRSKVMQDMWSHGHSIEWT